MSTSANTTPRPDCKRVPWLLGTLMVTRAFTFGCSLRWYVLLPVRLNWARIVASCSWSGTPTSPCDSVPPGPRMSAGANGKAPGAVAAGVLP